MIIEGDERKGYDYVLFPENSYEDASLDIERFRKESLERLYPCFDMTLDKLIQLTGFVQSSKNLPKHLYEIIVSRIIGRSRRFIDLVGVSKHVFTTFANGNEEHAPFATFRFDAIKETPWESSWLCKKCMGDFLFVEFVSRKNITVWQLKLEDYSSVYLRNAVFWHMPPEDVNEMKILYNTVRNTILTGVYEIPFFGIEGTFRRGSNLPKIIENRVGHVRCHAPNDAFEDVLNGKIHKQSFWLNAKYVRNIMDSVKPTLF